MAKRKRKKLNNKADASSGTARSKKVLPFFMFCTRLCENETNVKLIQEIMGHKDIQTTLDIYAECTQEKKQEVFANLNGKIMVK